MGKGPIKLYNTISFKLFCILLFIIGGATTVAMVINERIVAEYVASFYDETTRLVMDEVFTLFDSSDKTIYEIDQEEYVVETIEKICRENEGLSYVGMYLIDDTKNYKFCALSCSKSGFESWVEEMNNEEYWIPMTENEKIMLKGDDSVLIEDTGMGFRSYTHDIFYENGTKRGLLTLSFETTIVKNNEERSFGLITFVISALSFAVLAICFVFVKKIATNRVNKIGKHMQSLALGKLDLNQSLSMTGGDEIQVMSQDFNTMIKNIRGYIDNIDKVTASRLTEASEMDVAAEIQRGLLPLTNYKNEYLSIETMMEPAKYVGGDFYDYIDLGQGRTAFVIADVSGKGTTAALIMSTACLNLRYCLKEGMSPGEALARANDDLIKRNPKELFVTVFVALYDVNKGLLSYANAGHNPPFVLKGSSKEVCELNEGAGTVIGIFEDEEYEEKEIIINEGDLLFMFTDGVNEAMNEKREQFGKQRIIDCLLEGSKAGSISTALMYQKLQKHRGKAEQNDDITMLMVSFEKEGKNEKNSTLL